MATRDSRTLCIAHVTDSEGVYGAESVLLDLCEETAYAGHRPVLLSIGTPESGERPVERAARDRGIAVRPIRMRAGLNPAGALRLVNAAAAEHADVLHTHGYKGDILLGMLPRAVRKLPIVATVHGYTDVSLLDPLTLYRWVDGAALRRIDRVVLVHQGMTSRPALNRLDNLRWRVIENGVRPVDGAGSAADDPDIQRLCAGGRPIIGAIGRLSKEKGFQYLLEALPRVIEVFPQALLLVLGEGPERASLEQLARSAGIESRVLMPGYRANARRYLSLFNVFVLSSLTEGLPITILEAMQAGVPIVSTRVGGVPHVLDQGRSGQLVESGNSAALGDSILTILRNEALAESLKAHAKAQVELRFSSRAMASRYIELYREVSH